MPNVGIIRVLDYLGLLFPENLSTASPSVEVFDCRSVVQATIFYVLTQSFKRHAMGENKVQGFISNYARTVGREAQDDPMPSVLKGSM